MRRSSAEEKLFFTFMRLGGRVDHFWLTAEA